MWRLPMTNGLRPPVVFALALWMILLAILGFTRLIELPVSDKALHFVGFGTMSVLLFFAFQATIPRRKVWALTVGTMLLVSFFSEVLQRLFTGRQFDWADIVANLMGALTFLFAAWMVDRWIVQPRARNQGYRDSSRYWVMESGARASAGSADYEIEDEMDVELDEIFVDTPPQQQPQQPTRSPRQQHISQN
ncbi:hypothetical protein BX661DRAFT_186648 [Kickxella alabastrina]|uniref:uncharacterized protein n=1 Tax=Kickxella alabastrina TaxID=61397 RepID=UPI00221E3EA0|nr:uncharacterized protein BX661DRAFT_186648 [Kickxella alabastrina]KAI7823455.1 hypothetical protein BX661DRAFT_186648 [Kickxella alabastrina]